MNMKTATLVAFIGSLLGVIHAILGLMYIPYPLNLILNLILGIGWPAAVAVFFFNLWRNQ